MLAYLIKRLLLVVPTIFAVLVLSFLLKLQAPGDEVYRLLELEGISETLSKERFEESYRRISNQYGFDRPPFYFSILPNYFPDTLHRIHPKSKRVLLTNMLRSTKSWPLVESFHHELENSISNFSSQKDRVIYTDLLKLELDQSLGAVKSRFEKIAEKNPGATDDKHFKALELAVSSLQSRNQMVFPRFKWNGGNNQFQMWIERLLSGKKNVSLKDGQKSFTKIGKALNWTFSLTAISLLCVGIITIFLGLAMAYWHHSVFDKLASTTLYMLYAVPLFWLATIMVVFFTTAEYGAWTNIFPSIGIKPTFRETSFFEDLSRNSGQLVLPIVCLTISSLPYIVIQLKSDILDALKRPYSTMAKAKGLDDKQILKKHALPNAMVPFTTIMTGAIPALFTGSVIIEVIFNIPGVGRLLFDSIMAADWPVIFSILVLITFVTIAGFIIGDLLLVKLYPKTVSVFASESDDL